MRLFVSLLVLVLVKNGRPDDLIYRLPLDVIPITYNIKLKPNIDDNTFVGEVEIFVKVLQSVSQIQLHSKRLVFQEVALDFTKDVNYSIDPSRDLVSIYHKNNNCIPPGEHVIYVSYNGTYSEENGLATGFRKVPYKIGEKEGYVLATDFEPDRARAVFPCFDEPHFKAKFHVKLITPNNTFTALSNMELREKIETKHGVVHDFLTSVVMPPYIVTLIITDYPYREYLWYNRDLKVPIRIYSPFARKEENSHVLRIIAKCLDFLTNYTNIPYPLSKLDLIEYDRDVAATENWGMVTCQTGILSPSEKTFDKSGIAEVLCHEMAHMWFGNLVTNYWWNDLWLQEGFAVFLGSKACSATTENFELGTNKFADLDEFMNQEDDTQMAVVNPVINGKDTADIFHDVTYLKGGKIIKMVEETIGEEKLQRALRNYLQNFSYKSATTWDMIDTIEQVAGDTNVRDLLTTWLYQKGHPIILISEDQVNNNWILTQEPFPSLNANENILKRKWTIPITYYTNNDRAVKLVWFDKEMDQGAINKEGEDNLEIDFANPQISKIVKQLPIF